MAESSSSVVDAGVPNLNLTAEEKRVYGQLFQAADSESVGVVTGEIAVKFFEKTGLDSRILGEIWQIADKENRGFLTPAGFGIVLRLIGHAQAGREPTPSLALQQGPIPRFDGFTPTPAPPPPPPPAAALQPQGSGPIRIPPLTPEKVAQYSSLFGRQPLQNGNMLPGEAAKQIFEKSGLSNEILGRIWMLADTEQRGALVQTEFVIAMHLLTSMKTGALRGLPNILPAALYEAATRRGSASGPVPRQQSPTIAPPPPISAVPRQMTGPGPIPQMRTGSPLGRPPITAQTTGDWLVTPADKVRFDQLYDELDKTRKGFITGEEAVPFFSQSKLNEDVLAQIWDLADVRSEGRLNKDEFAIAMYLIRQQRSSRDGVPPLPATLPPNLVPPSLRAQVRPQTANATSAFEPPARPQPPPPKPSALDDLFGLDDIQPPAAPQVPVATGGSVDPFGSTSPVAPASPIRPPPTTTSFKPFMPTSSFGRGLSAQVTGGSNTSASAKVSPLPPAVEDDLLGDNEPEASKISNDTTELANLSNQIGSLTKQVTDVQNQRSNAQAELSQSSILKKEFEQRLAQLRALYEKEAQDVQSLQTQLTNSKNETKKLQAEMAMLDTSYQDLKNQHHQVLTALQNDQQENASLKEKIRSVNAEIGQLKPQIEKLKSEARQQKGLVAINKKQLATNEGEREKLKSEVEDLAKSNEELARQVSSSSSPVLTQVASPALSTASANNPFFRRTGSTDIAATFSPPIRSFNDKTFDDVFGPVATGSQSGTPPPPAAATLFKPQNTGTSTGSVGSFATPGSTSPTMSRQATLAAEAPAPPESRQFSSSFLPFSDASESLSTSRQVSPPATRNETPLDPQQTPTAAPIEPARTGQSLASASDSEAPRPKTSNGPQSAFATDDGKTAEDPFGTVDQAKAKEDFESAFASFKNAKAASSTSSVDTAKAFNTFNTEFPPISELERDDESDSESDRGGFDDDFAPASPPAKSSGEKGSVAGSRAASPTMVKAAPAENATTASASEQPPASERPTTANTSSLPSPPQSPPSANTSNNIAGSSVDDIFGSRGGAPAGVPAAQQAQQQVVPPPSAPSKTGSSAFDDLDDDFEGLEDAKEGSADDDFANISRSGLDDFNPVFDSSPPASQPSQAKSEMSINSGTTAFGGESQFDFVSGTSVSGSTTGTQQQPTSSGNMTGGAGAPEAADWDAIFAGLDDTPRASSPPTTKDGAAEKNAASAAGKESERPNAPGRALTEEGEHDDPILKNLTSMGYARADALAALEKYDYNLERAANFLASQS